MVKIQQQDWRRRDWLFAATAWVAAPAVRAQASDLVELAQVWDAARSPRGFAVSEKLDGVRALWDGRQLRFRSGRVLDTAPDWFLAALPSVALDGELWLGRGRFAEASGLLRALQASDADWRALRYLVFDAPRLSGDFARRHQALRDLQPTGVWQVVPQFEVDSAAALQARLRQVVAQGGEGLVLHRWDASWQAGRSGSVFKFKPLDDAEAQVVGYRAGAGKYAGQVGALVVRDDAGREFALGSGLSDADRVNPPAIGSWVTYRHQGLTAHGLPRFAVFVRVRPLE